MAKGLSNHVCSIIKEVEREIEREMNATEVPYLEGGYRKWMDKEDGKKPSVINCYVSYLKSADRRLFDDEEDFFELLKRALNKGRFDEIAVLFDKYIGIITEWIEDSKKEDVGITTKKLSDWRSGYNNYRKFFEYIVSFMKEDDGNVGSETEELTKIPESTDKLFLSDQFIDWMVEEGIGERSASSYVSYIKRTNKDFFCKVTKNNIDPLASLASLLKRTPNGAMNMLIDLEGHLVEEISNKKYSTMPLESLTKGRAAFRQYIKFMSEVAGDFPTQDSAQAIIEEGEESGISFNAQRIGYEYEDLLDNFRFRLMTQDRMSESKDLFFPIRLINRLFHLSERISRKTNPDLAIQNGKWIDTWAYDCIGEITVHTDKGDYVLKDISRLEILPDNKQVVVTLGSGETAVLFTETENRGTIPLESSTLSRIHIDHTPLMSVILKENSARLPALQKFTKIIREEAIRQNITITTRNFSKISKAIFAVGDIAGLEALIPSLKEELILLRGQSTLALMSQSENLKKKH